eukprot:TRINITY_DN1808_c0_g2_i25.p1 TRINITY_DN1808_c0_g2~~TRINITY_DN1808_c0_g2_i25.p1  ORF type:complete len:403 (+),score=57.26 TRINITY_DN1808_c0_g2_i25:70-1278(+)
MGSFGSKIERYRSCAEVIHPHTTCDKFWLLAGQAAFLNAVKIYGPLFLWSALMQSRFKPSPKALLTKTVPAILRSCLFLSCVAGLFPLFMCIWSRRGFLLSHFGWLSMAWLAGIIGILIEKGNRRIELTVYVANQALEVLYRMLMNRGILPQIERGSEIVFALSFAVLHSFYKHHPQHITNSASNVMKVTVGIEDSPDRVERFVSRFYFWYKNKFSGTTLVPRWIFSKDWRDVQQSGLGDKNDDEKTRLCSHPSGCKSYSVIGALKGFSLGLAIRFTFSLLPALVKTRKLLTLVLWKKILMKTFSLNSLKFGAFLGAMGGGTRMMNCLLRTLRKTEDKANTLLSGLFGGLAVVFFTSTEFAMYLVGKALESLYYYSCEQVRSRREGTFFSPLLPPPPPPTTS